jgi:hypothetical protein
VDHLAALPSDRVGERDREAGDAVAVDVGVDVRVRLPAADGVDQRRRDRVNLSTFEFEKTGSPRTRAG